MLHTPAGESVWPDELGVVHKTQITKALQGSQSSASLKKWLMMTCSRCGPDVAEKYVDFFNGQGIFTTHELKDKLKLSMDGTGFTWPGEKDPPRMTTKHQNQIKNALRSWSDVLVDTLQFLGIKVPAAGSLVTIIAAVLTPKVCTHMPAAVSGLFAVVSVCPSES